MEELDINGEWPELLNKKLDELIIQEYWYKGKLTEQVNSIWLNIQNVWHRLYFDFGIIFWRKYNDRPNNYEFNPDDMYNYPLREITSKLQLKGQVIKDCTGCAIPGGSQVIFFFANNQQLIFKNINDNTTYEIIETK
ncbi:MAG: hypothetical protein ABUK01_14845 [Leptospirales bacterium]